MTVLIKNYLRIIVVIIMLLLGITTYILYQKIDVYNAKIALLKSNEKAFILQNSQLKDKSNLFYFNVKQLELMNDSIVQELNIVRKELKIKDKAIKQLQYLLTTSTKVDSIIFRDTLFRNPQLNIDTIIGDKWYQLKLNLKYPSTIITHPSFISEKYIVVNTKKETIESPSKVFFIRWFQKKHEIVEVHIIEKSPYSTTKEQKFIEIIK